jgi:putative DNA primase/helicase
VTLNIGVAAEVPPNGDGPVLVNLADVAPEAVEWLWHNRIARGKLALVVGEAGTGKTYTTLDMGARTTEGAPWPDGGIAPAGAVLLLASEDGLADTVRPIVDRQHGDPRRVSVLRAVRVDGQECSFSLERDLPALEQALAATAAVLAIISPLSAYLGSKDSYKDAEVRAILTPLAALAEKYRVALVGILHLTKAAQRRLLLRAQGSVAFVAQARTVLAVGEDPDTPGRRLLVSVKNNLGPLAPALAFRISEAGLAWEPGIVEGTAEDLLAGDEPASRSETHERDLAVTFLRDLLAEGPATSKQIMADAKANGIAQRTLWRAKAGLGIIAERAKGQTGAWYWMLPPPGDA